MSVKNKIVSAILAVALSCALLCTSVFAATSWSSIVTVSRIQINRQLQIEVLQNSRNYYAITSTSQAVNKITSTVTLFSDSTGTEAGSDTWTTTSSTSSEAFYPVPYNSYLGVVKAKGRFVVENGGVTIMDYTSGYNVSY